MRLGRNFYLSFIREKLKENLSANAMLERLKEIGVGIRRADFLSMVREVKGEEKHKSALESIRRDRIISEKHYIKSDTYQRDRYLTVFEIKFRDPFTGETLTKNFGLYHENLKTRGELEQEMITHIRNNAEKYEDDNIARLLMNVESIKPIQAYTRGW